MSNAVVTFGGLVNATTGAVDSAYTQGSSPSPVNAAALNANIIGLATSLGSFLPGGAGAIVGIVGGAATGVGLGLNVGAVFLGATAADRVSAGIGTLGAIAGIVASNPFVPPQVRIAGLLAQAALTGISGAISRDPALVNGLLNDLSRAVDWFGDAIGGVMISVNRNFQDAQNWIAPRDPLVLYLDSDGIEAVGINPASPVMFDHDAYGVRTGTGWIKADDGILVLDLNGNGIIDGGRELFGDNALLPTGQLATNGYLAVAQHDSNGNGRIESQHTVYRQLRVWQDANRDGLSLAGELRTPPQRWTCWKRKQRSFIVRSNATLRKICADNCKVRTKHALLGIYGHLGWDVLAN